jgi:zinc/manganese transport system substrate-binding protein
MKKIWHRLAAPLALVLALLLPTHGLAADKLPVVASFSILADLVQVVGGERVNVVSLVGPNEDAHVFEPKPSHSKSIAQAKLVVINGLGFEPWAQKLVKSSGYKGRVLVASEGIKPLNVPGHKNHNHGELDPHAWQNPDNVAQYVRNIAAALAQMDSAGAGTYEANAKAYIQQLQALDSWAKEQFGPIALDKRKVITSHDAFGYLGVRYQIAFLAPQGLSTEAQPSAKQVATLIRQIKRENIKAVFVENMSNPKLLAQLSQEAAVTPGGTLYADALSAANEPAATYLQMMRHNITQLAQGMKQN